ncbi:MAG: hypothetical protein U0939_09970 [Pirellulales bacterium]
MRLTLRTLLAYLDDLLEPADAVEMGKRIEENKIATELVQRIRTRMRLLRLGAPKVDGRGIGLDANSVAEYLDNTLPADRVLDFEKVCLESDVHLAEVASCHQVLAAVMDKPAHVDPNVRLRMYNLIRLQSVEPALEPDDAWGDEDPLGAAVDVVAPPPVASAGAEEVTPPPIANAPSAGSFSATRLWVLALSLALVCVFVLGGLRLLGPFDATHPLAAWRSGKSSTAPGVEMAQNDIDAGGSPSGSSGASDAAAADQARADQAGAGGEAVGSEAAGAGAPNGGMVGGGAAGGVPEAGAEAGVVGGEPAAPGDSAPTPDELNGGAFAGNAKPGAVGAAEAAEEMPPEPPLAGAPPRASLPLPFGAKPRAGQGNSEGAGNEAGEDAEAAVQALELGRFLSEEHILARRSAEDGLWYRLARGARLSDGDRLVSLPVYRPQLLLTTGVQVMLVGDASLQLKAVNGTELPELSVDFGRLICASSGRPGASLRLNVGGETGQLRFVDVDAEVAVEVRRSFLAGIDPATEAPAATIAIYARNGKIGWLGAGGREEIIGNGEALAWSVGQESAEPAAAAYPQWTSPPSVGGLDRRASEDLVGFLKLDRPITLSLGELAEFRKTEVRSLAARCLGVLGQYDALWNELISDKQYSYWDEAVDGLRDAVSRSPEEATEVLKSIERLKKRNAADLYRMLRGYDASQVAEGGAAQLVDFLEHDDLEMRVLAFENLRRITESTHNYRPEKAAEARRLPTQEWRRQLKEGRIAYKARSAADGKRLPSEKTSRVSPSVRVR